MWCGGSRCACLCGETRNAPPPLVSMPFPDTIPLKTQESRMVAIPDTALCLLWALQTCSPGSAPQESSSGGDQMGGLAYPRNPAQVSIKGRGRTYLREPAQVAPGSAPGGSRSPAQVSIRKGAGTSLLTLLRLSVRALQPWYPTTGCHDLDAQRA